MTKPDMRGNSLWIEHRIVAVTLGVLAAGIAGCVGGPPPPGTNLGNGSNSGTTNDTVVAGVEIAVANEGDIHVATGTQVEYENNPPASGSHWSEDGIAPAAAGFYDTALEEERWVHNLEHGYVVILYDCGDSCSAEFLADLQQLFEDATPSAFFETVKMIITPYDGLPFLITAVAWNVQLHLEAFDAQTLLDYYDRHLDDGPELAP